MTDVIRTAEANHLYPVHGNAYSDQCACCGAAKHRNRAIYKENEMSNLHPLFQTIVGTFAPPAWICGACGGTEHGDNPSVGGKYCKACGWSGAAALCRHEWVKTEDPGQKECAKCSKVVNCV